MRPCAQIQDLACRVPHEVNVGHPKRPNMDGSRVISVSSDVQQTGRAGCTSCGSLHTISSMRLHGNPSHGVGARRTGSVPGGRNPCPEHGSLGWGTESVPGARSPCPGHEGGRGFHFFTAEGRYYYYYLNNNNNVVVHSYSNNTRGGPFHDYYYLNNNDACAPSIIIIKFASRRPPGREAGGSIRHHKRSTISFGRLLTPNVVLRTSHSALQALHSGVPSGTANASLRIAGGPRTIRY